MSESKIAIFLTLVSVSVYVESIRFLREILRFFKEVKSCKAVTGTLEKGRNLYPSYRYMYYGKERHYVLTEKTFHPKEEITLYINKKEKCVSSIAELEDYKKVFYQLFAVATLSLSLGIICFIIKV